MDIEKLFKEWIASKPDEQISYATAFQLLDFVAYVKKAVEQNMHLTGGDSPVSQPFITPSTGSGIEYLKRQPTSK